MDRLLLLIALSIATASNLIAQKLEFSVLFSTDVPGKSTMMYFPKIYSPTFELAYFPKTDFPLGIDAEFSFSNFQKFEFDYNFSSDEHPSYNTVLFRSRINRRLIGVKLSNRKKTGIFNPFFSAKIGFGKISSLIIEKETVYSYYMIETEEEDGTYSYEEEGYVSSNLNKEKLIFSEEPIYMLKSGLEISRYSDSYFSLILSAAYTGSFNSFNYSANYYPSNKNNYEDIKQDFLRNAELDQTKLSLWQFSVGIQLKI